MSGEDRFRPFRLLAQHQNRFAQRRPLFLNASRIGDEKVSLAHEIHERHIVQRLDKLDVRAPPEMPIHGAQYVRIRMYGIDQLHIASIRDLGQRTANSHESVAKTFPAMRRDDDQLLRWIQFRPLTPAQSSSR